jgi:nitroreductase
VADWPVIDEVAVATRVTREPADGYSPGLPSARDLAVPLAARSGATAEHVILGRRSAVDMDGATALAAVGFFRMLARTMPAADAAAIPWDAFSWRPRLHLALFVHRVDGMRPGLYMLVRDGRRLDALKAAARDAFQWHAVDGAPSGLPLYLLAEGDCRAIAARVSCGQTIAADGAFSAGMIADYLDALATEGPSVYRRLFWEAGAIGQVLYLEAEAAGLRATGIGCFFDDAVHELLGLRSRDWQSLYHFTVGGPVEDTRLSTLPAYEAHPDA